MLKYKCNQERHTNEREENKMTTYTLTHKHCGAIIIVEGYDYWHACKVNGLDVKVWKEN